MDKDSRYPSYGNKDAFVRRTNRLTGWKYGLFIASFVGAVGGTFYLVAIQPMLHPEGWQEIQKVARAGIRQEDIQPGNMKVWTDPFDRTSLPKERRWFW